MNESLNLTLDDFKVRFKENFWCVDPLYINFDPIEFDKEFDDKNQKEGPQNFMPMQPSQPTISKPAKKKGHSRPIRKSKNTPIQEQTIVIQTSKESYELSPKIQETDEQDTILAENQQNENSAPPLQIKPPAMKIAPPSGPPKPRPRPSQPQPPSESHGRPRPTLAHKSKQDVQEKHTPEVQEKSAEPEPEPKNEQEKIEEQLPEVDTQSEEITDDEESENDDPFGQDMAIKPGEIESKDNQTKGQKERVVALTPENIMHPLMPGTKAEFTLLLSPTAKKCEIFKFKDANTQKVVLTATKERSFTQEIYNIFVPDKENKQIARVNSNFVRNLFYTSTCEEKPCEISALKIKSSQNSVTHTQQLVAYLSPIDEHIPANPSQSVLANKGSSKVIEYVSKLPKMKDGIPILQLGDRVKLQSVKNFILVSEQNMEEQVLSFGKSTSNSFAGEVSYPLSPLQALSLCLPQFKF